MKSNSEESKPNGVGSILAVKLKSRSQVIINTLTDAEKVAVFDRLITEGESNAINMGGIVSSKYEKCADHPLYKGEDHHRLFPINPVFKHIEKCTYALLSNFWIAEHFEPEQDRVRFQNAPEGEQYALKKTLGMLVCADAMVGEYLEHSLSTMFKPNVIATYFGIMKANEAIHNIFYNKLIPALVESSKECEELFDLHKTSPTIRAITDWIHDMCHDMNTTRGELLVMAVAFEGVVLFSAVFAIIFWVGIKRRLKHVVAGNTAVRVDETIHTTAYGKMLSMMPDPPSKERRIELLKKANDLSEMFAKECIGHYKHVDMSHEKLQQHCKATTNYWAARIGAGVIYMNDKGQPIESPCTYMNNMSLSSYSLMFEDVPVDYRSCMKSSTSSNAKDDVYDEDF